MRKKAAWIAAGLLVALGIGLVADRMREKTVAEIYPNLGQVSSCKIITVTISSEREELLEGQELASFLAAFSQVRCADNGRADNIYEGQLYHLYFFARNQELDAVHITSIGELTVGSRAYRIHPDDLDGLIDRLEGRT